MKITLIRTHIQIVMDNVHTQTFAVDVSSENQEWPQQMSKGFRTPEELTNAIQQAGLIDGSSPQPATDEQLLMLGI